MELCKYPCPCKTRQFKIEAIQIPIVYNKYGDHDPNGLLYVLEEDAIEYGRRPSEDFRCLLRSPVRRCSRWYFG